MGVVSGGALVRVPCPALVVLCFGFVSSSFISLAVAAAGRDGFADVPSAGGVRFLYGGREGGGFRGKYSYLPTLSYSELSALFSLAA